MHHIWSLELHFGLGSSSLGGPGETSVHALWWTRPRLRLRCRGERSGLTESYCVGRWRGVSRTTIWYLAFLSPKIDFFKNIFSYYHVCFNCVFYHSSQALIIISPGGALDIKCTYSLTYKLFNHWDMSFYFFLLPFKMCFSVWICFLHF